MRDCFAANVPGERAKRSNTGRDVLRVAHRRITRSALRLRSRVWIRAFNAFDANRPRAPSCHHGAISAIAVLHLPMPSPFTHEPAARDSEPPVVATVRN